MQILTPQMRRIQVSGLAKSGGIICYQAVGLGFIRSPLQG
jgi:hypothetical protein